MFPVSIDANIDTQAKVQDARVSVRMLFEGMATGSDTEAFKGTAYGAYNSVVEYMDYNRKGTRTAARWVGPNGDIKARAFDLAMDLATA